jgi:hypothetical protein
VSAGGSDEEGNNRHIYPNLRSKHTKHKQLLLLIKLLRLQSNTKFKAYSIAKQSSIYPIINKGRKTNNSKSY